MTNVHLFPYHFVLLYTQFIVHSCVGRHSRFLGNGTIYNQHLQRHRLKKCISRSSLFQSEKQDMRDNLQIEFTDRIHLLYRQNRQHTDRIRRETKFVLCVARTLKTVGKKIGEKIQVGYFHIINKMIRNNLKSYSFNMRV